MHIPKSKFPPVGVNGGNVPTDEPGSGTAKSTRTGTENTDAHNPARNAKSQNPKFNNIPNGRRSAPTAFPARTKFSDRVKKLKSAARSINVEEVKKFVSERYGPLQARFSATHIRFSNVVRNEQKRRAKQAVEAYNNVKAENLTRQST